MLRVLHSGRDTWDKLSAPPLVPPFSCYSLFAKLRNINPHQIKLGEEIQIQGVLAHVYGIKKIHTNSHCLGFVVFVHITTKVLGFTPPSAWVEWGIGIQWRETLGMQTRPSSLRYHPSRRLPPSVDSLI